MTAREAEIIELIRKEVKPALGCTEPIAVALAVAKAMEIIEEKYALGSAWRMGKDYSLRVEVSGNILKNGMGVGIPGTGMVGLHIAAALGAVAIGDGAAVHIEHCVFVHVEHRCLAGAAAGDGAVIFLCDGIEPVDHGGGSSPGVDGLFAGGDDVDAAGDALLYSLVDITDEALEVIAEAAEGGMRDALGLLDQSISYSTDDIRLASCFNLSSTLLYMESILLPIVSVCDSKYSI